MGKKKKRSGGGGGGGGGGGEGGGGGGVQQEEKPEADAGSGCEGQAKEKPADDKDKDKEKGGGGCKDDKADKDKDKDKGCGGGKDDKGGKDKAKKPPPPLPVVTAVLKVDMHCDGCAHRIRASVRRFPGVEGVAMEVDKGSMTVVGRFDAKKLRDRVAAKTRKKVELVGGKDNKGGGDKDKCADGGGDKNKCADGEGKKEEEKKEQDDKCGGGGNAGKGKGGKDNKKPAVPVIVTVVLKIGSAGLHCDGCMHRIRCKLFKIKGVEQVKMDPGKNQVTVTGTMDAKALPEKLRKKLRRPVDVVPPGKGDNKEKDKDGCNKDGKQQQQQQQGGDGKQCKEAAEKALAAELQLWKTAFYDQQAMQATEFLLSDENPNACAVM
ncbi:heavy metal-associated isoprenylated plant protein 3 [Triticum aestivum]|uniref:heavy metal-associated isoprenylated plant protein 3 n=1 Tax=Triticum aestivum TaxID=4565 RepID=UPI0008459464|nr:heavy metal-associated isoprenylated plant protein 3-like [Triticum aestivum]